MGRRAITTVVATKRGEIDLVFLLHFFATYCILIMEGMIMEVKVIKWDVNWLEIKNLCRKTISMKDSKVEPSKEWKRELLLAEHSPLRHSLITIDIIDLPYAMMGHLVRHHVGVTPYVTTSRSDRTGVDRNTRSQMDLVSMRLDLNIQSLINISRKRLCKQADKQTIEIWEQVLDAVKEYDEDIYWACVPEGIRSCGCTEAFGNCKQCPNILKELSKEELLNVGSRYDVYNKHHTLIRKKARGQNV